MADGSLTEEEAVDAIIHAVYSSDDDAGATVLYRNRHETHEISYNYFEMKWELMQTNIGEVIATGTLKDVATKAVDEELWIEE